MSEKKRESIWTMSKPDKKPSLRHDMEAEVVIIGGGMAGILTAYQLKQIGIDAIVLEADQIGHGATHNTTAKITSQHNLIYTDMLKYYGFAKAVEYAKANQAAVQEYVKIINEKEIDCDLEMHPAFVYTTSDPREIEKEAEVAKRLGLPASFTTETALPFQVTGAVRVEEQYSFHPLKFLYEIAKDLTIYEHSRVIKVIGEHELQVECGRDIVKVTAEKIVITTHYPFMNMPGYYFAKMHQDRSYVVAAKVPEALSYGMYIGAHESGYSFRKYKDYVLVGGYNHRTGQKGEEDYWSELIQAVNNYYDTLPIACTWANQDCISIDGIPYIGRLTKNSDSVYVATGFNKWGMSTSMVAAMMIRDCIAGHASHEQSIFSPRRFKMETAKEKLMIDVKTSIKNYTLQKIFIPSEHVEDLKNGEGGIIRLHGKKVGIYKDEKGRLHGVSTKCPHLGCMLSWNQAEKTWDCPCHGSRFDYEGNVLNNPANDGLEQKHELE